MTDHVPNDGLGDSLPPAGGNTEALRANAALKNAALKNAALKNAALKNAALNLVEAAPAVRRYLFGLCGDWHRSEDLSQEALLKAWQNRDRFDGRSELRTWVFAIARNQWLTSLRQEARRMDPQSAEVEESPDAIAARGELVEAVARALGRLPSDQREVLALRENGGLTFAQVADVLGVPIGTVKSRARYALLKLAEDLEPFRQELEATP